jgi:phosphoribosylglycinamide formyltransferase 1
MRVAILASGGGSAFIESWLILCKNSYCKHEFFVITDRKCDIEAFCKKNQLPLQRIEYESHAQFSIDLHKYIQSIGGVDIVFLYFLRILTKDFFRAYPCLNIHPSLLPAFRGLNAVKQFLDSGAKFLGATLHLLDEGIDTGDIIAQIQVPVSSRITFEKASKISFLEKVYLTLVGFDLLERNCITFNQDFSRFYLDQDLSFSPYANPELQNHRYLEDFTNLMKSEGCTII